MLPYLKGQEVFGYVDGTIKPPLAEISAENGISSPNPMYAIWIK